MRALLLALTPWALLGTCYLIGGREGLQIGAFAWVVGSPMLILIAAVLFEMKGKL